MWRLCLGADDAHAPRDSLERTSCRTRVFMLLRWKQRALAGVADGVRQLRRTCGMSLIAERAIAYRFVQGRGQRLLRRRRGLNRWMVAKLLEDFVVGSSSRRIPQCGEGLVDKRRIPGFTPEVRVHFEGMHERPVTRANDLNRCIRLYVQYPIVISAVFIVACQAKAFRILVSAKWRFRISFSPQ